MTQLTYTDVTHGQPAKLVQPDFIEVEYRGVVRKHDPVLKSVFIQHQQINEGSDDFQCMIQHTFIVAVWTFGGVIE